MARHIPKAHTSADPGTHSLFVAWVNEGLKKKDKTKAGMAKALGIGPSQAKHITTGKRSLKADDLAIVARYIEEPLPQIPGLKRVRRSGPTLSVTYKIGLGAAINGHDGEELPQLHPGGTFSFLPQYAAEVLTNDVDMAIPRGSFAVYVRYFDARNNIHVGDFVIAHATSPDHKKSERSPIIRRVTAAKDGKIILSCESSDHRLNAAPITLNAKLHDKDGFQFELIGLITHSVIIITNQ